MTLLIFVRRSIGFALLCCASHSPTALAGTGDDDALNLARQKFAEIFVEKDDGVVTKYTHVIPFGHPADWSFYQYKNVSSEVSLGRLSEADKLNGVTWRGGVVFKARFSRTLMGILYPEHEAFDGLHPDDWRPANRFFEVRLEQRNGKWTVQTDNDQFGEFSKLSAADLLELNKPLQQGPAARTAEPTPTPDPDVAAAKVLGAKKLEELFLKTGDVFSTKSVFTDTSGRQSGWSIQQYRGVTSSFSVQTPTADEAAKGVTWRGSMRYDATSHRSLKPKDSASRPSVGPPEDEWIDAGTSVLLAVKLAKCNGQWIAEVPSSDSRVKMFKPTEAEMRALDAGQRKL